MRHKTIKWHWLLALSIIFTTCKKVVDISYPGEHKVVLFIEGMLYPGQQPKIFVSTSNPFFSEKVTPQQVFARGASVSISDGIGSDILHPDSVFNQFRCRWEPFFIGSKVAEYGKTYDLLIQFNGETYKASTTINQKKIKIDSIEYTPEFFDIFGSHDGVVVSFRDPAGSNDYYRFQMNRIIDTSRHHANVLDKFVNTCVSGPEQKFPVTDIGRIVFDDLNADGQSLKFPMEVSFEYKEGDSAWVTVQSIDKNSAEFYRDVDDQLQAIQNPFVEPVMIGTKISGALGVFGSAVLSDSVLFVYPNDTP